MNKFLKWFLCGSLFGMAISPNLACKKKEEPAKANDKAQVSRVSRNTNNEPVLTLDLETQKRIGLVLQTLSQTNRAPGILAYGNVLDPSPLAVLVNELKAAEAAADISRKQAERAKKLFSEAENVSRKTVETAEAQLTSDELKFQSIHQRLELDWGTALVKLESSEREKLIGQLVAYETVLIRVDVAAGQNISANPTSARIEILGNEQTLSATVFSSTVTVNSNSQGQGFLLQASGKNSALRPGLFVKAYLTIPGSAEKETVIPSSAVVRFNGKTWIYLQSDADKFIRREVEIKNGVFTSLECSGEKVVATGAQILLSEELKSENKAD